ncbi:MAG TPA: zf-HC2 domain-containing protein [Candidatus Limnocylindria bacterium]|nr:zf-HC2 domain-containing protein [Candidatus Limnocylindria bacterium]
MNCSQSRRLFNAYWDDEVTQAEREWLESHFATCESCRAEYEAFVRVLEWVGALPRAEVSPGLAERALARARRSSPAPDRIPSLAPRWIPITAAAALVAVIAATLMQWTGLPPSGPVAVQKEAPIEQPMLVEAGPPAPAGAPGVTPAVRPETEALAVIPDSLFDHGEDVEFILDPVTLRKGRAYTVSRLAEPEIRGESAVITF